MQIRILAPEPNHKSEEKVIELTIGREESNLKELEFSSTMLTMCPPFPLFSLSLAFTGSVFLLKHYSAK